MCDISPSDVSSTEIVSCLVSSMCCGVSKLVCVDVWNVVVGEGVGVDVWSSARIEKRLCFLGLEEP